MIFMRLLLSKNVSCKSPSILLCLIQSGAGKFFRYPSDLAQCRRSATSSAVETIPRFTRGQAELRLVRTLI
jgi:hypothetical protein